MTETATTEKALDALAPYSQLRAQIEELKAENKAKSFDISKPAGIKAAKSHIYSLRKLRAEAERTRKDLGRDALEYKRRVDSVGKELIAEVEGMIEVHERPLKELEEREESRKRAHIERLATLRMPEEVIADSKTAADILSRVESVIIDEDWEEFCDEAQLIRDDTVSQLTQLVRTLKKAEEEAAELARLRKDAAKREAEEAAKKAEEERIAREEQIARDAAEKARRETEEAAEHKRLEAEKAAEREREQAVAEAEKRLEAEREKARAAELEASRAKQAAAEAEAARVREEKAKAEAQEARAANKRHRNKVMNEVAEVIEAVIETAQAEAREGVDSCLGQKIAEAIAEGKVPHVSVRF